MPQWTPEEARANAAKGQAARRARLKKLVEREALLDQLISEASTKAAMPTADPKLATDDSYLISRLAQVRAQLAALSKRMDDACNAPEIDAKALFALSGSYRQVQEMEQTLSGRPSPGSLRPSAPRRQAATFTPPSDA
jgi:hypothetical protein